MESTPVTTRPHSSRFKSPLSPIQDLVVGIKSRLERQFSQRATPCTNKSPGLTQLRNTPATCGLQVKPEILLKKHREAKDKVDTLGVGGGVSLWPEMEDMRLSLEELTYLSLFSAFLIFISVKLFFLLHGELLEALDHFSILLREFPNSHSISIADLNLADDNQSDPQIMKSSLLQWHYDFKALVEKIERRFDVELAGSPLSYKLYALLYFIGVIILLFYLADNVFSTAKLTPKRIKRWVSLLTAVSTWTILLLYLLIKAQTLESSVEYSVRRLDFDMGELFGRTGVDLSLAAHVTAYWRMRCSSRGVVRVLGALPLRDVAYYLQYYSLPLATALLTPVFRLLVALKDIYLDPPLTRR